MAQVLAQPDIPSAFVRQDDTAFTADRAISAHELQTLRSNQNILLARRTKIHLFSAIASSNGSASTPYEFVSAKAPDRAMGDLLWWFPLYFQVHTQSIIVKMNCAKRAAGDGTIYVYGVIDGPEETRAIDTSVSFSVTSTTMATKTLTVPVPRSAARKGGEGRLMLYALTPVYASTVQTGVSIDDRIGFHVRGTFSSSPEGKLVAYSDKTIQPGVVRVYKTVLGSYNDSFMDNPPDTEDLGSITMEVRTMSGLKISEISGWEVAVTDFGANRGEA